MNITDCYKYGLIAIFILVGCKKIDTNREMAISTDAVAPNGTHIVAKGTLIDLGENDIETYGFCWSDVFNPTLDDNVLAYSNASETGSFSGTIANVTANRTYFIRAFADDGSKIVYGNQLEFIPVSDGLQVISDSVILLTASSVNITGHIENVGSLLLYDHGFCWANNPYPAITDLQVSYGSLSKDTLYSYTIAGLNVGVSYYACAYARVDQNTVLYGDILSFSIPDLIVTTDSFNINGSAATLYGTIVSLGIPAVTEHGFCWSLTTSYPTMNENRINLGSVASTGSFSGNLPGLIGGSTYYLRAFATDGDYVKYGQILNFTP